MTDSMWLAKALQDCDLKPRSYSGRFMYGKQCLGVVTDDSPLQLVGQILVSLCQGASPVRAKQDVMDLAELLGDARMDSMGLGTIIYFPSVTWCEEYADPDSAEEDDDSEDSEDEGDCDDSDDGGALASAGMGTDEDYGSDCHDSEDT